MEIHTFRADSLQEALELVRDALGPDASVLQTREVRQNRLGFFSRRQVEVEASCDMRVASRFAAEVNSRDGAGTSSRDKHPPHAGRQPHASHSSVDRSDHGSAVHEQPRPAVDHQRLQHQRSQEQPLHARGSHATTGQYAALPQNTLPENQYVFAGERNRLSQLRGSHTVGSSQGTSEHHQSLTSAMLEVMSNMLEAGIEAKAAKQLLLDACRDCDVAMRNDLWIVQGQVSRQLASELRVSGPVERSPSSRRVVALVGPTGVGKTTTLAKIAAGFRFDLGLKVGLITLDTFRLGAVDQLLQYAELLSATLEVVSSPEQVGDALRRLEDCDLVLLDTAGRSPRDQEQLQLTSDFLTAARPDETHLVVSATSAQAHVEDTLKHFRILSPDRLLITKLDEAVGLGAWLDLLRELDLPISYVTAGQHVPQDIAVATPRRLASLLLGQNQHQAAFAMSSADSQRTML